MKEQMTKTELKNLEKRYHEKRKMSSPDWFSAWLDFLQARERYERNKIAKAIESLRRFAINPN